MAKPGRFIYRDETAKVPASVPLSSEPTTLQRWRFRRNLLIYLAYREGFSQHVLADAFDLTQGRVRCIVLDLANQEKVEITRRPRRRVKLFRWPETSMGRRRRFRRDELIHFAHQAGLSTRFIADVFDMTRSQVSEILGRPPIAHSKKGPKGKARLQAKTAAAPGRGRGRRKKAERSDS